MNTPIKDSNLAHTGTIEHRSATKAAAETEVDWEGAGSKAGIQIWRVENLRDENGNPKFGINPWPEERYGNFYSGDSYVILHAIDNGEDSDNVPLIYDIYFWIGRDSSQDEYGVAAYKAVELDDLLSDAPIQHREVQEHESDAFLSMFDNKINYLEGGIDSGFRSVDVDEKVKPLSFPTRCYHVRRTGRATRCQQVPPSCESLNLGDAFVLDAGSVVYTWFGSECSPFEKSKAAEVGHNIIVGRTGQVDFVEDVEDDNEDFWDALGGKGYIKEASEYEPDESSLEMETEMFVIAEVDSILRVDKCDGVEKANLEPGNVFMVDTGKTIFVWIGEESSKREQLHAMSMVQDHIQGLKREMNTNVVRILQGQEERASGFDEAF